MADNRKPEITKKQIRAEVLAKRDALSEIQRKAAAESVYNQVINDPLFIKAKRILGFMPFGSEIDIINTKRLLFQERKFLHTGMHTVFRYKNIMRKQIAIMEKFLCVKIFSF